MIYETACFVSFEIYSMLYPHHVYTLNLKPPLHEITLPVVYAASGVQSIAMTPAVSDS